MVSRKCVDCNNVFEVVSNQIRTKRCALCAPKAKREKEKRSRAKCREQRRKYAIEHEAEAKIRREKWKKENPEKDRLSKLAYYHRNRDRTLEYKREYYQRHKSKSYEYCRQRLARKAKAAGRFTVIEFRTEIRRQSGRCFWCSRPLEENVVADHIIPLSRGGSDNISNIAATCPDCNLSKWAKLAYIEWIPPNPLSLPE